VIGGMSREKAGYPLIGYFASNNAYAAGLKTPRISPETHRGHPSSAPASLFAGAARDKYCFKLADVKVLPLHRCRTRPRR